MKSQVADLLAPSTEAVGISDRDGSSGKFGGWQWEMSWDKLGKIGKIWEYHRIFGYIIGFSGINGDSIGISWEHHRIYIYIVNHMIFSWEHIGKPSKHGDVMGIVTE